MWKADKLKIRLFGPFWPKSGLFRQKEDQFRSIFSKRSAIRPRSDKADLLGSTDTWSTFPGQEDQDRSSRQSGHRIEGLGRVGVKAIRFPTKCVETISTMCDSVRNGVRCWKIPLITSFGLSKGCR